VVIQASLGHQFVDKEELMVFLLATPAHELNKVAAVAPAPTNEFDEISVPYRGDGIEFAVKTLVV